MKVTKVAVIGGGIAGLSAACYAAKKGYHVELFEKNPSLGGRARQFKTDNGYTFDMGPSWYWMPDVMENFFNDFGYHSSDFYELINLNPQFEIIFQNENVQIPSNYEELKLLFETYEKGSGKQLDLFMDKAKIKYKIGMEDFIEKPCNSWLEFFSLSILKNAIQLDILTNYRTYVSKYFKHPFLQAIMEFPVIFLGASPNNIPAMYSLMNYGGYRLGTWYPIGGFYQLILAMEKIAKSLGVIIHTNTAVEQIISNGNRVEAIKVNSEILTFDSVIGASDYHHLETLLDQQYRNYSEEYWNKKTFAPSCLIYYLGISERIPSLKHHTLFFENELDQHIGEIYENKKWPTKPLFYVCCPSQTDPHVAPENHENLFLLMPLAIGIEDREELREKYLNEMISRIEKHTGVTDLKSKIDYKKSYCINDFKSDYNAFGGNAYGLANTLNQTAVLKPAIRNKKLKNLVYAGQLTVPGPGVPPSLISGKIAANQINPK